MIKFASWRELLSSVISNTTERERIAKEMGVRSITLTRWATGESVPRQSNLHQLLLVFPETLRAELLSLLKQEIPDFASSDRENATQEIALSFVLEVLRARTNTPDNLLFWTICRLVLRQALQQLDPQRQGMSISVVSCMIPGREEVVRTLLENIGLGTLPWEGDLEPRGLFLGAESLSGYAVTSCRFQHISNLKMHGGILPAQTVADEVSAAACPIMYTNRVAGCLLLSSTQLDYFASDAIQRLLQGYADLTSLAFLPQDFYQPESIRLSYVPSVARQQPYLNTFRQRVNKIMRESSAASNPLNSVQAEQMAWKQIEEELLYLPPA
jgi:hypothetical protein